MAEKYSIAKPEEHKFVSNWEKQIKFGIKYRDKYSSYKKWKIYRQYYRGAWDKKILPVNTVFSFIRGMIPKTYFRNPGVAVTALRPEMVWPSRVVESVDNYLIGELALKGQLKKSILHGALCGIGPIKLGYDSEFGFLPSQAVTENSETATQLSKKTGEEIEYQVNVKPGMPWALAVKPEELVIPWGYDDVNSIPWIAHEIIRPLDDVKADQKYKNTEGLKGGFREDLKHNPNFKRTLSDGITYTKLYEIRVVKSKKIVVICEGRKLLEAEDELQIEGLPWEMTIFNPDAEHFWPISDVQIMEPQVKEINEIRTQASRHRKILILKMLIKKGMMEPGEYEKFLNDDIAACVEVNPDTVLSQDVMQFVHNVPTDIFAREGLIAQGDLRDSIGFGRNQGGSMTPSGNTPPSAYEVGVVQQAFESRSDERRDVVADVLSNIIRKWNQFIFKFWSEERVADIVGPDGKRYWVKYTGDQIKGEYFYRIDPEAGMPISRALRNQEMEKLFEQFRDDPYIDQLELRRLRMRTIDWLDPSAVGLVRDPQSSIQQAMQTAEGMGGGADMETVGSPNQPMELQQLIEQGGGR